MAETNDWADLVGACLRNQPYFGPALKAAIGRPPNSSGFDRALAQALTSLPGGKQIAVLEVGSWVGQSAIEWVRAGERRGVDVFVHMVDPWMPYHQSSGSTSSDGLEIDQWLDSGLIFDLMQHNIRASGLDQHVRFWRGSLAQLKGQLPWKDLSLVYIDGSHKYEDVKSDLELSISHLPSGAVLCGDDLELQATESELAEIRKLARDNADFVRHDRHGGFHPGVTLAVHEVVGHVRQYGAMWIMETGKPD